MARPEKPLVGSGPVVTVAAGLRRLRKQAGAPRYQKLSERTGYSASTLSKAASGERFPTMEVTLAFVRGCDGDVHEWTKRWKAAKALLDADAPAHPDPLPPVPVGRTLPSVRDADPLSASTAEELARELRILRIQAGKPSFAQIAGRAGYSKSTVHAVMHARRRLPNLEVVQAVAAACHGDPETWTRAWMNIAVEEERRSHEPAEPPKLRLVEQRDRDVM